MKATATWFTRSDIWPKTLLHWSARNTLGTLGLREIWRLFTFGLLSRSVASPCTASRCGKPGCLQSGWKQSELLHRLRDLSVWTSWSSWSSWSRGWRLFLNVDMTRMVTWLSWLSTKTTACMPSTIPHPWGQKSSILID